MDADTLSYDDSLPYDEQLPTNTEPAASSLADRIGSTKVYLLSDASSRLGKRKHADADGERGEGDDEMDTDQDPTLRANALLLQGPPIAHLPTARLFEYAAHFDVHPLGLEWIDDITCIFVFSTKAAAKSAFLALKKPSASSTSDAVLNLSTTELYTARPVPVSLWPPEDRIHHSLGVGQGLRGTMSIRWALNDDKKKRGAKKDSEFYRKHGLDAGKESAGFGVSAAAGAGHASLVGRIGDTLEERIALDDGSERSDIEGVREWDRGKPGVAKSSALETRIATSSTVPEGKRRMRTRDDMDVFLGEDLNDEDSSPPSKMRSDYIARDGRTLISSANDAALGLTDRITIPLPRRARGRRGGWGEPVEEESNGNRASPTASDGGTRRPRGGGRRGRFQGSGAVGSLSEPLRKKTREELDEELDAFLSSKT